MIGDQAVGFDWGILASILLFVLSAILSVIGYFLKRLIDQNDRKICLVEEALNARLDKNEGRIREVELGSVSGYGAIRVEVAKEYVPETRCTRQHQELGQTIGKIFLRLDDLAKDVATLAARGTALARGTPT